MDLCIPPRVLCFLLIISAGLIFFGLVILKRGSMFRLPLSRVCNVPQLHVDDPTIQKFLKQYGRLKCNRQKNWVFTKDGKIYIDKNTTDTFKNVNCNWKLITRVTDNINRFKSMGRLKNSTDLPGDTFSIDCVAEGNISYSNIHMGVAHNQKVKEKARINKKRTIPKATNLNVYIYLLDSMSRINFMRKLPNFYDLLVTEMDAIVMEGFNIVGDGTPWTMIPILTGHFQTELYEGRKRFENASFLDDWPLIFKNFSDAGYITSYAEEQPNYSFFSYKLKGFRNPPVDHYLRVFLNEVNSVYKRHKPYCLGDTPRSIILCNWWKEQQEMYTKLNINTFSLLFSSETSHDDYNYVQVLDQHWTDVFSSQWSSGLFNNTILIVMGDHGRRFGSVRQTQSGKTEEKLPFLSFILPEWFKHKYKTAWKNLKENRKRLITPFDIHETLMSILNLELEDSVVQRPLPRGITLFNQIPADRTCSEAAIQTHFCSCLDWSTIGDVQNENVTKVANFIVDHINNLLLEAEDLCSNLSLRGVDHVSKMTPSTALLSFKESADYDNISPDLTAETSVGYEYYQLKIRTQPGTGMFEATVIVYNMESEDFRIKTDDISRINMYGSEPHCIMQSHTNLRQYCVCKEKGIVEQAPGFITGT